MFGKLILRDFWGIVEKKQEVRWSKKIHYFWNEVLSRFLKFGLKSLFIRKLMDSENTLIGIVNRMGSEEVICTLCGSSKVEPVGEKRGFRTVRCSRCGLEFTTPRFNREGRQCFHSWKYYFLGYPLFNALNKLDFVINENFSAVQILDLILLYRKTGNLIEIGPFGKELTKQAGGRGFKCWRLRRNGWAYDYPVEERKYGAADGSDSIEGKKFDVVSCLDLLDRIPHLSAELNGLYRILEDDGILLIRIPSYSTVTREEKGKAWHHNRPWEKIYQFDYFHLRDLLDKTGFKIIDLKTELSDGVGSPGCIIIVGMKKNWRIKKRNPRILVIREGAAGDVLLTTPIVRQLKKKFPQSHLVFKTNYPEILQNNPYVDEITNSEPKGRLDGVFNLMYELYPDVPIIEAYEKIAQLSIEYPRIRLYLSKEEREWVDEYLKMLPLEDSKGFVVIHPMMGDRIKWWNGNSYQLVSDYIRSKKLGVVTVGSPMDCVELKGAMNLIRRLSLRQSAALISRGKLFIGLDSFPMHVANAFNIPSVVLFGSTDPGKILSYDCRVKVVQSSEHCLGCREDTTPDRWKQNAVCRRQRLYCMESISPGQVIEKIGEILNSSKRG